MTKNINDLDDFDKPREKLKEKGPRALTEKELIAILIGSGSQNRSVLEVSSKIKRIIDNNKEDIKLNDLLEIEGVGLAKAARLIAGIELARRLNNLTGQIIRKPEDVLPIVNFIRDKKQEYFICISLNGANEVIKSRVITKGLVNKTQVHPREVFAPVLEERGTSVIFAHNHPSGNLKIGQNDRELTKNLIKAGDLLGIKVLDHIVVSSKGYKCIRNKELY